jgi:hypothetical protein
VACGLATAGRGGTVKLWDARPWTPEGAVGIAGPCLAIYPVPSPGGYQLLGRTLRIFDLDRRNQGFGDSPFLLRPVDRVAGERRGGPHENQAKAREGGANGSLSAASVDNSFTQPTQPGISMLSIVNHSRP